MGMALQIVTKCNTKAQMTKFPDNKPIDIKKNVFINNYRHLFRMNDEANGREIARRIMC